MGYQMPNVIKEIYIPCDESFLNGEPTLEEYKEKYGIDLEEVFNIKFEGGRLPTIDFPKNAKIYLVAENYADLTNGSSKVAIPNFLQEDTENFVIIIGFVVLTTESVIYSGFGIRIHDDRTLSALQI